MINCSHVLARLACAPLEIWERSYLLLNGISGYHVDQIQI